MRVQMQMQMSRQQSSYLKHLFKRESRDHTSYLEHRFGENISCECDNRVKLLIDFGSYALQHYEESVLCVYSCRQCQYNRMMKGTNECNGESYTFRI